MNLTCRPISSWPWPSTAKRKRALFKSGSRAVSDGNGGTRYEAGKRTPLSRSLDDLWRELTNLGAKEAVLEVDLREDQIRIDGWPKATATARTPRVVVSFTCRHGPLRYKCDTFDRWEDNLRAVALSLEALRTVDRYGVTSKGEQYAGWKALPASTSSSMDPVGAAWLIRKQSNNYCEAEKILINPVIAKDAIREAAKLTHPDAGGTTERFQAVQDAKRILEAHHGVKL